MNIIEALNAYNTRIYEINETLPNLSDIEALAAPALFPKWEPDIEYELGKRVRYNENLYRCEQTHTSQSIYPPDLIPAIWTKVTEPGKIDVWRQPTGAQDAYRIGDKVYFPQKYDQIYICISDYNTYAPNVYGWEPYENQQDLTNEETLSILLGGT